MGALLLTALSGARAQAAGQTPPDGPSLFAKHCAGCHGAHGEGVYGPQLAGVVNDKYPVADRMVVLVQSGTPQGMPPFFQKLSESEIRAIVDFVRSLPPPQ